LGFRQVFHWLRWKIIRLELLNLNLFNMVVAVEKTLPPACAATWTIEPELFTAIKRSLWTSRPAPKVYLMERQDFFEKIFNVNHLKGGGTHPPVSPRITESVTTQGSTLESER
jgi:hypothetical protein